MKTALQETTDEVQATKRALARQLLDEVLDDAASRERLLPRLALAAGAVRMDGAAYSLVLLLLQMSLTTPHERAVAEDRLDEALAELTLAIEADMVEQFGSAPMA